MIFNAKAQSITDFRKEQNKEYTQALVFLELEHWMVDSLECNGINAAFALAIVFPELIRYSAIQNWAETKALEVLYAQYGEAYADFSIGNFQMKPSFAKRLEQDWNTLFSRAQQYRFGIRAFDTLNNQSYRYQRIKRLNDLKSEVKYLLMFILIMDKRYHATNWISKEEKLKFYATAYNTGYWKTEVAILNAMQRNTFHTAMLKPIVCYNYADIAVDFYSTAK